MGAALAHDQHRVDDRGLQAGPRTFADGQVAPVNDGLYLERRRYHYDGASREFLYEEYHPHGTSAYRAVDSTVDVSAKRYRYTGMERDEETGLGYHSARYYVPWLGRWSSAFSPQDWLYQK